MQTKSLLLFAILSFILFSCDDGIKFNNPNDPNADISDSQNDEEKDQTDSIADEDPNEQTDTENPDKKQGELDGECYPNKTCNDGLICDKDNNICTKDSESSANNNDDDSDSTSEQSNDDNDADTTPDSSDSNPDEDTDSDSGDSTPDEDTNADSGDSTPDDETDTNSSEPEPEGLLECKFTNPTPCKDKVTGFIWSSKSSVAKLWSAAVDYCNNLNELGVAWRLPEIYELRTLIENCTSTQPGGTCQITKDCVAYACNEGCDSCSPKEGYYSKLNDAETLWSNTKMGDASYKDYYVWILNFRHASFGYAAYNGEDDKFYARCIRK